MPGWWNVIGNNCERKCSGNCIDSFGSTCNLQPSALEADYSVFDFVHVFEEYELYQNIFLLHVSPKFNKWVPMCGLVWCRSGVSTYNVEIANKLQTGEWFQVPDLALRDHYLVVPLDYENPRGSSITIFVREVVAGTQPRSSCSFPNINSMCDESGTFI